jgi:hypothetical protein
MPSGPEEVDAHGALLGGTPPHRRGLAHVVGITDVALGERHVDIAEAVRRSSHVLERGLARPRGLGSVFLRRGDRGASDGACECKRQQSRGEQGASNGHESLRETAPAAAECVGGAPLETPLPLGGCN